jgi:hypothetical protein
MDIIPIEVWVIHICPRLGTRAFIRLGGTCKFGQRVFNAAKEAFKFTIYNPNWKLNEAYCLQGAKYVELGPHVRHYSGQFLSIIQGIKHFTSYDARSITDGTVQYLNGADYVELDGSCLTDGASLRGLDKVKSVNIYLAMGFYGGLKYLINVNELDLTGCQFLLDDHLIEFYRARGGRKLTKIVLDHCHRVSNCLEWIRGTANVSLVDCINVKNEHLQFLDETKVVNIMGIPNIADYGIYKMKNIEELAIDGAYRGSIWPTMANLGTKWRANGQLIVNKYKRFSNYGPINTDEVNKVANMGIKVAIIDDDWRLAHYKCIKKDEDD